MQFLKKNYEKLLLGLVLIGLVAVAVAVLFMVASEKAAQAERRKKVFDYEVTELPKPDVSDMEELVKRAAAPITLTFAEGGNNRLFNPVRWQKGQDGKIFPNPSGEELKHVRITRIAPLFTTVTFESASTNTEVPRYVFFISRDLIRGLGPPQPRKGPAIYLSKGEKRDPLALIDVRGPATEPTEVLIELTDTGERVWVAKGRPYKRAESYVTDFVSKVDKSPFINRRSRDHDPNASKVNIGGTDYIIVNIGANEVVFQAPSGKKTSIPFNSTPQEPQ